MRVYRNKKTTEMPLARRQHTSPYRVYFANDKLLTVYTPKRGVFLEL